MEGGITVIFMRFPEGRSRAVVLSYDDGVEQDAQLMEILDRHGIKCTFNINSGMFAPENKVWEKGYLWRRLSQRAARDLYRGTVHEVAAHGLTHASLTEMDAPSIAWEILMDRANLERTFGRIVRGMAYADGAVNDEVVKNLGSTGIVYARTAVSSHGFDLPSDWMRIQPTCHHGDPELMPLVERFLEQKGRWSRLFYLWGHSYEFERDGNWQVMEAFASRIGGRDDIWYATNLEIYEYIQAYRNLVFSADGEQVRNPARQKVWFEQDGVLKCV